jgi:hypothetical protein
MLKPFRRAGALVLILASAAATITAPAAPAAPAAGAEGPESTDPPRPADLVELRRRPSLQGEEMVGVFKVRVDPGQSDLRRVQLWEQRGSKVVISTDVLRCATTAPSRLTGRSGPAGRQLVLRSLNPGGPITSANRLDHLVWWAACAPELAGRDPAGLVQEAHRRGFHGGLPEREEILPAPPSAR